MASDLANLERPAQKKSVVLSGVVAGSTAVSSVIPGGDHLRYRGYDVRDLAMGCGFEEIAHLLVHGALPSSEELATYQKKLRSQRNLPPRIRWMCCELAYRCSAASTRKRSIKGRKRPAISLIA